VPTIILHLKDGGNSQRHKDVLPKDKDDLLKPKTTQRRGKDGILERRCQRCCHAGSKDKDAKDRLDVFLISDVGFRRWNSPATLLLATLTLLFALTIGFHRWGY
jgi:hypothetical protein